MKKFNLLYLMLIPVVLGVYYINSNYGRHSAVFFGFAETKDTEISHDHPVQVDKIHVEPGQFVSKGDLLLEVSHAKFGLKMNDLSHDIEAMQLKVLERREELKNAIEQLEARRQTKLSEIDIEVEKVQAEIDLNRSLLKDLKSVEVPENQTASPSPSELKLTSLQKEREMTAAAFDLEIGQLQEELANANSPLEVQVEKLRTEQTYYEGEQQKLSIIAPSDGLIGNVNCREGENKSSFSTLITFYERNPTQVSGYVHENLIVRVKVGDTLDVSSTLHPEHRDKGIVTGLGSRIVEIPERLRKRPEIKTYGREVLIRIPSDNPFLQKEKVVLNFLNEEDLPTTSYLPFLESQPTDRSRKSREAIPVE